MQGLEITDLKHEYSELKSIAGDVNTANTHMASLVEQYRHSLDACMDIAGLEEPPRVIITTAPDDDDDKNAP